MFILIVLLYLLLASTFTLAKAALLYIDPLFFIALRMIVAGFLLFIFLIIFRPENIKFNRKHTALFMQIALFHIYGAYVFEFLGLPYLSSAKACLMYSLTPFLTIFLAYKIMAEKMSRKKWLGLIIGFLGFIPVLVCNIQNFSQFFCVSWPEAAIFASVLCSAQGWVVMQKLVKGEEYSPLFVNGFGMVVGGFFALFSSLIVERFPYIHLPTKNFVYPLDSWLMHYLHSPFLIVSVYSIVLILIANLICYNLYGYLLKKYSATFISFAGILCPLFTALYGNVFLSEKIPDNFFISVTIIFIGLFLFYQEELESRRLKTSI
jgi:drug/metabolite transporter (DMT)-like permease